MINGAYLQNFSFVYGFFALYRVTKAGFLPTPEPTDSRAIRRSRGNLASGIIVIRPLPRGERGEFRPFHPRNLPAPLEGRGGRQHGEREPACPGPIGTGLPDWLDERGRKSYTARRQSVGEGRPCTSSGK